MRIRYIIFLLFALSASSIYAQKKPITEDYIGNKLVLHCRILYQTGIMAHRLEIDYGFKDIVYPQDANGEEIKFNSQLAALNYMTLQGWHYYGEEGNYLLLKKEVTKEEATELIENMKYSKKKSK